MQAKRVYYLRQETPMIHFQSEQEGACLRGTEVKSKLDKYILKVLSEKGEKIDSKWYINENQSRALKYKVKIDVLEEKPSICEPHKGLYFGNMGGVEKKTVWYRDADLQLSIVCFIPDLINVIDQNLEAFFLLHNFGTRQNRGFGSFVLKKTLENKKINEKYARLVNDQLKVYRITYDEGISYEDIFNDIDVFANVLKSGRNTGGVYLRSFLVKYCLGLGIAGDKRIMKQEGIAPIGFKKKSAEKMRKLEEELSNEDKRVRSIRYIRGLLGSSEGYKVIDFEKNNDGEYKRIPEIDRKTGKEKKNRNGKPIYKQVEITIKSNSDDIKRIPSPILYKIIENELYIIVRTHSDVIYNAEFTFSSSKNRGKTKGLRIPSNEEVNIQSVVKAYVDELNSKRDYYKKMVRIPVVFMKNDKGIEEIRRKESVNE